MFRDSGPLSILTDSAGQTREEAPFFCIVILRAQAAVGLASHQFVVSRISDVTGRLISALNRPLKEISVMLPATCLPEISFNFLRGHSKKSRGPSQSQ
jgi:hypothetical protein